jgi:hypothetical protein
LIFDFEEKETMEMGWRGKTKVHANGSWMRILLGMGESKIGIVDRITNVQLMVVRGGTLGDLFEILGWYKEGARLRAASKAMRERAGGRYGRR